MRVEGGGRGGHGRSRKTLSRLQRDFVGEVSLRIDELRKGLCPYPECQRVSKRQKCLIVAPGVYSPE